MKFALLLVTLFIAFSYYAQTPAIDKAKKDITEAPAELKSEAKFDLAIEYYNHDIKSYEVYRKKLKTQKDPKDKDLLRILVLFELKKEKKWDVLQAKVDEIISHKKESPWMLRMAYGYKSDIVSNEKGPHASNAVLYEALKRLRPSKQNRFLADIYNKIGINLYNLGEYEKAVQTFEYSADLTPKYDVENKGGRMMNIGVIKYRSGDFKESLKYYDEALKILGTNPNTSLGNTYVNMAISLNELNKTQDALQNFVLAERTFKTIKDTSGLILALQGKADVLRHLNRMDEALEILQETIRYHKKQNSTDMLATAYCKIAEFSLLVKDTNSTMTYLQLANQSAVESNSYPTQMSTYIALGRMYTDIRKFDLSAKYYAKAETMATEMESTIDLGSIYLGIGNLYKVKGDSRKAIEYYEKAIPYQVDNIRGIAGLYSNIGVAWFDLKQYDKALENYKKALEIRKTLGNNKDLYETYQTFANVYEQKGDYRNAFLYYRQYVLLRDSTEQARISDKMLELQTTFKTEQIQDSLEIDRQKLAASEANEKVQKAQNSRNVFVILGMSIVLLLVAGLLVIIARNSRMRKLANQELTRKNTEIEEQKTEIEEKNKNILDSITYAKRLQDAILPPAKLVQAWLPKSFILYKPKDIVAGDFYWMETVEMNGEQIILYAAADCTGHGVPGAMISVVCSNALNRSVKEFRIIEPAKILDKVNELVIETFEKSETTVRDGMDISLCAWNTSTNEFQWAGANNPLWIIRDNQIIEVKGDKQPIGPYDHSKPFKNHVLELYQGDSVYNFSDGYADQFGGPLGKKMKTQRLREILLSIQHFDMDAQRKQLNEEFENWRGNLEQIDDVCVIGIQI